MSLDISAIKDTKSKNTEDTEIDNFHIGYASFKKLREYIAPFLGFNFYKKNPDDPFDYWLSVNIEENNHEKLIEDFLLHSDCSGTLDGVHIHELRGEIEKLSEEQIEGNSRLREFKEFINKSDLANASWVFE